MSKRARSTSTHDKKPKRQRKQEPNSLLTNLTDLGQIAKLWQDGKVTKREIQIHLSAHWANDLAPIMYKGKSLWDILMKIQDKIEEKLEKEEKKMSEDDDRDNYEYTGAFPQSTDCCMWYDMKNHKILGPYSVLQTNLGKHDRAHLPAGLRRVSQDAAIVTEYEKTDHMLMWYSK